MSLAEAAAPLESDLLLQHQVTQFLYAYARCLDEDRLEDWPTFFDDACFYGILPRENAVKGLPLCVLSARTQGMLKDRVKSLREANIYNLHYPRHVVSNVEILACRSDSLDVVSNVTVYQTDMEGRTTLFCVGQYNDRLNRKDGGALKIGSRTVTIDTYNIPNLLAIPI
ncbi:aromatic-ring-hydroxylating dioxygenase subunit beta [Acuticoccus mangrovi]|uniref:Aromatic-ring-hydroxylating dioxygenase subunit beta n=1 Tax=Acuticoccus mangrovi TaxID=2796142 RepID=A0A934IG40_9HYPH|nr:aromatic-ring-hydroxylating dioxygenase subunit beta [Acuticoccus mangrovi]MBJ3775833.1 aromatic-ring-hydroxylating dioxygenase subunit beta [Acuticoccus mangrovi]